MCQARSVPGLGRGPRASGDARGSRLLLNDEGAGARPADSGLNGKANESRRRRQSEQAAQGGKSRRPHEEAGRPGFTPSPVPSGPAPRSQAASLRPSHPKQRGEAPARRPVPTAAGQPCGSGGFTQKPSHGDRYLKHETCSLEGPTPKMPALVPGIPFRESNTATASLSRNVFDLLSSTKSTRKGGPRFLGARPPPSPPPVSHFRSRESTFPPLCFRTPSAGGETGACPLPGRVSGLGPGPAGQLVPGRRAG